MASRHETSFSWKEDQIGPIWAWLGLLLVSMTVPGRSRAHLCVSLKKGKEKVVDTPNMSTSPRESQIDPRFLGI